MMRLLALSTLILLGCVALYALVGNIGIGTLLIAFGVFAYFDMGRRYFQQTLGSAGLVAGALSLLLVQSLGLGLLYGPMGVLITALAGLTFAALLMMVSTYRHATE